jgi:hypothetical protein
MSEQNKTKLQHTSGAGERYISDEKRSPDLDILLIVHLSIIYSLFPTRYTALHVLLYHMAALHLYNFVLMFLYRYRCFACSALQILIFC